LPSKGRVSPETEPSTHMSCCVLLHTLASLGEFYPCLHLYGALGHWVCCGMISCLKHILFSPFPASWPLAHLPNGIMICSLCELA
jgi:hypothetical protein